MELLVTADEVALRLGLTTPLADPQLIAVLEEAIADAQATLAGYLGYGSLEPQTFTERLYPMPSLDYYRDFYYNDAGDTGGWPVSNVPVLEILSAVAVTDPASGIPTGYYDVTYTAGRDLRAEPRVLQYIKAAAARHPLAVRYIGISARVKTSASAEGQSVSWQDATRAGIEAGEPGPVPSLDSLDDLRRRGNQVYQGQPTGRWWP